MRRGDARTHGTPPQHVEAVLRARARRRPEAGLLNAATAAAEAASTRQRGGRELLMSGGACVRSSLVTQVSNAVMNRRRPTHVDRGP